MADEPEPETENQKQPAPPENYHQARQRAVAALSNLFAEGYNFFLAVADMYAANHQAQASGEGEPGA